MSASHFVNGADIRPQPSSDGLPDGVTRRHCFEKLAHTTYPNFEVAELCAELSDCCYREEKPEEATAASVAREIKKQKKIAAALGFKGAKIYSTPTEQCVIYYDDYSIVVAFEGTHLNNWQQHRRNLLSYFQGKFSSAPPSFGPDALVHYGLNRELDTPHINPKNRRVNETLWQAVNRKCNELLAMPIPNGNGKGTHKRTLYFTGHSAGGALAVLATARWLDEQPDKAFTGLYTFGQPRVGNARFMNALKEKSGERYFRFELLGDPVPGIPPYGIKISQDKNRTYEHSDKDWYPLDQDGYALIVRDGNNVKDTISRVDEELMAFFKDVVDDAKQANENKLRSRWVMKERRAEIEENFRNPANIAVRKTLAKLQDLQQSGAFDIHDRQSYRHALNKHLAMNPHLCPSLRISIDNAQNLLHHLIKLEECLIEARNTAYSASERADKRMHRDVFVINRLLACLDEPLKSWDRLQTNHQSSLSYKPPLESAPPPDDWPRYFESNFLKPAVRIINPLSYIRPETIINYVVRDQTILSRLMPWKRKAKPEVVVNEDPPKERQYITANAVRSAYLGRQIDVILEELKAFIQARKYSNRHSEPLDDAGTLAERTAILIENFKIDYIRQALKAKNGHAVVKAKPANSAKSEANVPSALCGPVLRDGSVARSLHALDAHDWVL